MKPMNLRRWQTASAERFAPLHRCTGWEVIECASGRPIEVVASRREAIDRATALNDAAAYSRYALATALDSHQ